jgi:DNA-directed RNA polymerase subunit beta
MQKAKNVLNFGKIGSKLDLPNLIEIQLKSYEWFLQDKIPANKRKSQGLQAVFEEVFP